jgi:hypothetical protein
VEIRCRKELEPRYVISDTDGKQPEGVPCHEPSVYLRICRGSQVGKIYLVPCGPGLVSHNARIGCRNMKEKTGNEGDRSEKKTEFCREVLGTLNERSN